MKTKAKTVRLSVALPEAAVGLLEAVGNANGRDRTKTAALLVEHVLEGFRGMTEKEMENRLEGMVRSLPRIRRSVPVPPIPPDIDALFSDLMDEMEDEVHP